MMRPPLPLELHLALRRRQQSKHYDYRRLTEAQCTRMREIDQRARTMGLEAIPLADVVDMITLYEMAEGTWPAGCDPWLLTQHQRELYSSYCDRVARGSTPSTSEHDEIREIEAVLRGELVPQKGPP